MRRATIEPISVSSILVLSQVHAEDRPKVGLDICQILAGAFLLAELQPERVHLHAASEKTLDHGGDLHQIVVGAVGLVELIVEVAQPRLVLAVRHPARVLADGHSEVGGNSEVAADKGSSSSLRSSACSCIVRSAICFLTESTVAGFSSSWLISLALSNSGLTMRLGQLRTTWSSTGIFFGSPVGSFSNRHRDRSSDWMSPTPSMPTTLPSFILAPRTAAFRNTRAAFSSASRST